MNAEYLAELLVQMDIARANSRALRASQAPPYHSVVSPPPVYTAAESSGYAVYVGLEPGVYVTWTDCNRQISGVPHNSHKRFTSLAAAQRAFSAAADRGLVSTAAQRAADIRRVIERQRMDLTDLPLCLAFLDDPTSKAMAEGSSRFYVVYAGLQPGVYLTFHESSYSTSGYKGARHASFDTEDEAVEAMKQELRAGTVYKYVLQ